MTEKRISNLIWGIIFLGLGIILLGNNLNFWNIETFFDGWWTLFIIIPFFLRLFKKKKILFSIFGLSIGILLLLGFQKIINFSLIGKLIILDCCIFISINLIFKARKILTNNNKIKK